MAAAMLTAMARDALTRMADRYAARAAQARHFRGHSTDYTGAPFAQQSGTRPRGSIAPRRCAMRSPWTWFKKRLAHGSPTRNLQRIWEMNMPTRIANGPDSG